MLATLGRAAADRQRACSTSRSTTASARWFTSRPASRGPTSASGRASATTRPRSSRDRPGARAAGARRFDAPLLIDGEIVALDDKGRPAGFQRLQGRIHLTGARDVERARSPRSRPRFIAFDLLRDGDEDLRGLPLTDAARRAREHASSGISPTRLRLSEQVAGDGRALDERAHARGLGRADRQGGRVAVSVRPAQPGVAQAQARQPTGVRRRRLDRAAATRGSTSARCCSAFTTTEAGA